MRIVQLVTQVHLDSQGGSPLHVLELSAALARQGCEVYYVVGRGADRVRQAMAKSLGVRLVEFAYHDLVSFPKCLRHPRRMAFGLANAVQAVLDVVGDGKRCVIHAHHMPFSPMVAEQVDRLVSTPFLTTTHGSDLYEGSEDAAYQRLLRRNCYGEFLVGLNETMMPKLGQYAGAAALERIPGGLVLEDHPVCLPAGRERAAPHMLYVGRLLSRKGVGELPEMLAHIAVKYPHAHLTVAGDGPLAGELRGMAAARGLADRVKFTGWIARAEVAALMRRCDVLLCPSRWPEPFARVLLESGAAGLPVVTRDVGGNAEILGAGYRGLAAPDASARGLGALVVDLMADPDGRQQMAEGARRHIVERYGWDGIATKYRELYEATREKGGRQERK